MFVQHPPTQLGTPVRTIDLGVKPLYIAVGDKGELFVTEHWDGQYTVLSAQGQRLLTVGSEGNPPFGDEWPTGIATDEQGNVYVASDHTLHKFNGHGELVKSVGENGGNSGEFNLQQESQSVHKTEVRQLLDLHHETEETQIIEGQHETEETEVQHETEETQIVEVHHETEETPVVDVQHWNHEQIGEFDCPFGVKYHNHQVHVCDCNNARVQVFDSNLNFVRSFGTHGDGPGQFKEPVDMDFDAQGNIYVVDLSKSQVLVFREDGQYLRHFGQKRRGKGELSYPEGLCVSGDYVYVAEWGNDRVSVFSTSGEFVHSFGRFASVRCELDFPYGIAIDHDGFVFVCDSHNDRIQVF